MHPNTLHCGQSYGVAFSANFSLLVSHKVIQLFQVQAFSKLAELHAAHADMDFPLVGAPTL